MKLERFLYVYSGLHLLLISSVLPLWVLLASGVLYLAGFVSLALNIRWPSWWVQLLAGLGLGATFMWVRPVLGLENSSSLAAWVLALQIHMLDKSRPRWVQMYVCLFALAIFLVDHNSSLSILVLFADLIFFFGLLTVSGMGGAAIGALSLKRAMRMVALSLPIWVLLFIFFPRFTLNLWGTVPGAQAQTGFAEELRPGHVSRVVQRDEIAFRFRLPDENYIGSWGQQFYLRGGVLNDSAGLSWDPGAQPPQLLSVVPEEGEGSEYQRQEIWLEPRFGRTLFGAERIAAVEIFENFEDNQVVRIPGDSYRLRAPARRLARYMVHSEMGPLTASSEPVSREELDAALFLPAAVREDLQRVTDRPELRNLSTNAAVVKLEQYYTRRGYRYTLNPPAISDGRVSSFMNDSRLGFCEHFAAVTATLMREAGIPARVVIGFLGGTLNPISQEFVVYDRDAHAWTELYDRELNRWVRYDPTAFIQPLRFEIGSLIYRMNETELRLAEVGHYAPGLWQSLKDNLDLYWEAWGRQLQRRVLMYDGGWLTDIYNKWGVEKLGPWLSFFAVVIVFLLMMPLIRLWLRPRESLSPTEKLLREARRQFLKDREDSYAMGELELLSAIEKRLIGETAADSAATKYIPELRTWFARLLRLRYAALSKDERHEELKVLRLEWARLKRQRPRQDSVRPRPLDSHVN